MCIKVTVSFLNTIFFEILLLVDEQHKIMALKGYFTHFEQTLDHYKNADINTPSILFTEICHFIPLQNMQNSGST